MIDFQVKRIETVQKNPELVNILNALKAKTFAHWFDLHSQSPERLYHYTSASGLIGIVTSKSLWMTDLRYMNDLSELQYSKELIRKVLDKKSEESNLTEFQKELLRRLKETFDPFYYSTRVYSTSFCEKGNLLSQWRAYRGQGGGYAIGFDLFHSLRFLDKRCFLRKIIYDREKQILFISDFINAVCLTLSEITQGMTLEKTPGSLSQKIIGQFYEFFSICIVEFMFREFNL